MSGTGDLPTVDVHAHVLLPGVDEAVAGQPGLLAARELDARRNGAESLIVSGAMVADRFVLLTDVAARLAAMDDAGWTSSLCLRRRRSTTTGRARTWRARSANWPTPVSPRTARRPLTGCTGSA